MSDQAAAAPTPSGPVARIGLPAIAATVLLVLALGLGGASVALIRSATHAIDRSHALTIRLERLLSSVKDVETGLRGYMLTNDDAYLAPNRDAGRHLDADLAAVSALGFDTAALRDDVTQRRDLAARSETVFRDGGRDALTRLGLLGQGKAAMDRLRSSVAAAESEADDRIVRIERRQNTIYWPMALGAFGALACAFALIAAVATHRRREQQASATLLRDIMENAPVGLAVVDREMRPRLLNRTLAAMGTPGPEHRQTTLWDVLPQLQGVLEPRLNKVLATNRPASADVALENPQADRVRSYQVNAFPYRTGSGEQAGVGLVMLDVTARRRAERRMQESEIRFRAITENSADIIWSAGPDGTFDQPQPRWASFTGQDEADTLGLGWLDAVHPDDRPATMTTWVHALSTRSPYAVEHRLRRKDGDWRFMAVNAVPLTDEDGRVREWVGTHTDITERKLAEAELSAAKTAAEASNRAKSTFLANMSHELRTPLSAVIGYTEMLEEEIEDIGEKVLLDDVGKIKTNARHLLGLINDVLDLSKIEANKMDTYVERAEVAEVVRELADTVATLVRHKNNTLEVVCGDGLGVMDTDVVKLRQCMLNLLSNAAKFTDAGRITLRVERSGPEPDATVTFKVIDTGIGMSADQVARLFQRFTQADETTTRKFGGTGLGLALTRAFARLLGGDVEVESVLGQGTTFTLTLPATLPGPEVPAAAERTEAPLLQPEGDGSRDIVLVIDDDSAQRDLIVRFLDRQGFAARVATDGPEGLELARQIKPRAILLDVMMPQMDGWQVLNAIKSDPDLGHIPVVMVTFVSDKGLSRTLGAADHLNKPIVWDELKGVMSKLKDASGDILVVDDDAGVRERLRTMLERNGWSVQEAVNGQDALAKVKHGPPRAILLDLTMPVMDGFSFLHSLRTMPGHKDIPVIVFTARDISAAERRELGGANRVLSKTVGLRELAGELAKLAPVPPDQTIR